MVAGWRGWAASHFLRVCQNRSILPWVWGVAGLAVLLPDFQAAQLVLQAVAAADEPGRVDGPVIGQCGGRDAVLLAGIAERGQHDGAGDPDVGGQVQHVPGVVIQPAQDLGIGARAAAGPGEPVVGEVGLPALVRLLGGEPQVGRPRPLGRVGGDQPRPGQVSADRRRRHHDPVMVVQVPADRVRPGVQAPPGQLLTQPDDQPNGIAADRAK